MKKTLAVLLLATSSIAASSLAAQQPNAGKTWWKHAVFYEIYPRSYQDSNGDGIGDLNGITSRLDYLQHLGIDAIWIAPMYPSPQVDFGYDISDYQAIDPQYGSLADMDRLIAEAKRHKIRVVLDMVLNHTSDKHQWFLDSSGSRTSPRHDWYVWNDGLPADGPNVTVYQRRFEHEGRVPPNNWTSYFGGSAWEWNATVKQFYYHKFYKQQPDLNWRNPQVEQAAFGAMRFWLDRGVAGFRLDAIPTLFEDLKLRDDPETGGLNAQGDPNVNDIHTNNLAEVHDVIRRMRAMAATYPGERVLIGETYLPNTAELDKWYGGARHDELDLPMDMLLGFSNKLDAAVFRKYIAEADTQIHGSQPLFVFDNHDNVRSVDRYAPANVTPQERDRIAKLLATVLLTTRSTALMYQGEELGMDTATPTRREDVKDPIGITGWPKEKGRDGERTPMQWTSGAQAGFSTNLQTWLPIPADAVSINVATEAKDPQSQLSWYERLINIRRTNPALRDGTMKILDAGNPEVLSYLRSDRSGASVVVTMNFTGQTKTVTLDLPGKQLKPLLTDADITASTTLNLPPYASYIAEVK